MTTMATMFAPQYPARLPACLPVHPQLDSKVASLHHQQVCLEASHAALATRCDAMAVHTQQLAAQLCLSEQERHRLALQCAEWQQHAQHGLVHATVMRAVAAVRRREELELSLKARLAQRLAGVKGSTPSQAAAAAGQPLGVPTPAASPVTSCPANSQAESMVGQPAPKPEAPLQDLGCRFCGTPFAPSYHKLEAAQLAELPACPVLGIEGLSWKTKVGLATGLQAGEGPGSALQALGQAVGEQSGTQPGQAAEYPAMSNLTDRLGDSSGLIPMPHPLDCITCHGWGAAGNQAMSGCHGVHADVTGQHAQHSASTATLAHPPSSLNGTLGTSTTTCSTGHLICDTLYGPPARLPSPSNRLLSRTATNPAAECGPVFFFSFGLFPIS
ncbi:hypothetical protein QJQ45_008347 [Haematococcus lacustris]|nr:hypothetical protein QJQ45_008347 [Haematococcus lacustris]